MAKAKVESWFLDEVNNRVGVIRKGDLVRLAFVQPLPEETPRTWWERTRAKFRRGGPREHVETMWVKVTEAGSEYRDTHGRPAQRLTGRLDNDPIMIPGLQAGDRVRFSTSNVIGVERVPRRAIATARRRYGRDYGD